MLMNLSAGQTVVRIVPVNEVYVRVFCEPAIAKELEEKFTFEVPGARFHPKVKARQWDGKIRLFSRRTHMIYRGLVPYIQQHCEERGEDCTVDHSLLPAEPTFTIERAKAFVESLKLPDKFELRDYQLDAFFKCIWAGRGLFVLPTGAGKSMIIYWLLRYYANLRADHKTLIVVDSINLIHQLFSDFKDYGFASDEWIHLIHAGQEKDSDKPIYITTWQSAVKQPKIWFRQFGLTIGDEAHQFDAKSFKIIMEALTHCPHKFGFTGTLTGSKTNQMVLEGLFGRHYKAVSTKELIDEGHLSDIHIKCIVLRYSNEDCAAMYRKTYQEEIEFLYTHKGRNELIKRLALGLDGNTLLLFQRVEQHGIPLYESIKKDAVIPVYYVSGMIEGEEREEIRKIVNEHEDSITVASVGTFSKGVNIPNINNIVVASPSKSQVRVLQSIGRGLRKTDRKTICNIYDIADDLSKGARKNYVLKHFAERLKMYIKEEFPYKIQIVDTAPKGD